MKSPKQRIIDQICRKHRLALILLHGSTVSGLSHDKSDVDVAVLAKNPHQAIDRLKLINDLAAVFPADKIDLTDLAHADPLLLKLVSGQVKLLAGKPKDLEKLKLTAFHRYQDYQPYFQREQTAVKELLKNYDGV